MRAPSRVGTVLAAGVAIVLFSSAATVLGVVSGCALGTEQEPGCHTDADCPDGWICREGACFHATTGVTSPVEDGGDAGDAALD